MARFQLRTFRDYLKRMAFRVVARTNLTDLEEGGVVHTVLASVAQELDEIGYQITNLQKLWDLDTATGDDLDERGKDLNPDEIERRGEAKAAGTGIFSRAGTVGTVTVAAGHTVKVPDGGPEFVTTAIATILDTFSDSVPVGIVAVEGGENGNVDPGMVSQMDASAGVETFSNDTATVGGQDEELDPEYRARMKAYLRSLPRGTPDAVKYAALSGELDGYGRVISAEVFEYTAPDLGTVDVFVDDGAGTIEHSADNYGAPEAVVAVASGGEIRMFAAHNAWKAGLPVIVSWWDSVGVVLVPLVENSDYRVNYARGKITLIPGGPAGIPVSGLQPGDGINAEYTWFVGLLSEVQKIIDGDPADRVNYPGYRAAGTLVSALPPVVLQQIVEATIVMDKGYTGDAAQDVLDAASAAINRYINGLGINGDVIYTELVHQVQSVPGVFDVVFTTPTSNLVIGSGELARVTDANIDLTGA